MRKKSQVVPPTGVVLKLLVVLIPLLVLRLIQITKARKGAQLVIVIKIVVIAIKIVVLVIKIVVLVIKTVVIVIKILLLRLILLQKIVILVILTVLWFLLLQPLSV